MSWLNRAAREEDQVSPGKGREEGYKYLYMKIARDFLTKEDFMSIMKEFASELGVLDPLTDFSYDDNAISLSHIYSSLISKGLCGKMIRIDLINMDDE